MLRAIPPFLRGRKGGKYKNTPDTLRSEDTVEVIAGVGEGENFGLALGAKSLIIGGTALVNSNDEANFKDFQVTEYTGQPNPPPIIPALGGFGSPTAANVASLATNTAVVRTGQLTNIDYLDLRFLIAQLHRSDDKGIYTHSLKIKIEYRQSLPAGQAWQLAWANVIAPPPGYNEDTATPGVNVYTGGSTEVDYHNDVTTFAGDDVYLRSDAVMPAGPEGEFPNIWVHPTTSRPHTWNGTTWTAVGTDGSTFWTYGTTKFYKNPLTPPPNPNVGDVWIPPNTTTPLRFNGSAWIISLFAAVINGGYSQPMTGAENGVLSLVQKITSPTVREVRVPVPRVGVPYEIRVTKISDDTSLDGKTVSEVGWESYEEIIAEGKTFPNTHILHLLGRASDQFNQLPELQGDIKGRIVDVPTNYDTVTRIYAGVWDGLFKKAWTDNPAWCTRDFIKDDRAGLSTLYPYEVREASFYSWGQWCDYAVPDNLGGSRPRWTYNDVLDQPRQAKEQANYMAGSSGGRLIDDGSGVYDVLIDRDEPMTMVFGPESVVDGEFTYSFTDIQTRANWIKVGFVNPELNWEVDFRLVKDDDHITEYGRIPFEFVAVGKTNVSEAMAAARLRLVTGTTEYTAVTFQTNRVGKYLFPFKVVGICDPDMGWGISGRLSSVSGAKQILLRDPVYLETGVAYKFVFNVSTTPISTVTLTVAPGQTGSLTTINFVENVPSNLPEFAQFAIESYNATTGLPIATPKPFKILTITPADGDSELVEITGIELNRAKWPYVDGDGELLPTIDYANYRGGVEKPTNVRIEPVTAVIGTLTVRNLRVEWDQPVNPFCRNTLVEYSRDGNNFVKIGESESEFFEIEDIAVGTHAVRLTHLHVDGIRKSLSVLAIHEISDYRYIPPVDNLVMADEPAPLVFESISPMFRWDHGDDDPNFKTYRVRVRNAGTNAVVRTEDIAIKEFIYDFDKNTLDFSGTPSRSFKICVTKVDDYGSESTEEVLSVSNTAPAAPTLTVTPAVGGVTVALSPTVERDVLGARVEVKVGATTELDLDASQSNFFVPLPDGAARLIRGAYYDRFSKVSVNWSTQSSATRDGVDIDILESTPPTDVTGTPGLTLTSIVTSDGTEVTRLSSGATAVSGAASYIIEIDDGVAPWGEPLSSNAVSNLIVRSGRTYRTRFKAVSRTGIPSTNWSAWSSSQSAAGDTTAPGPITSPSATTSTTGVILAFTPPTDADFAKVRIYINSVNNSSTATAIGNAVTSPVQYRPPLTNALYYFWGATVDRSGNESTTKTLIGSAFLDGRVELALTSAGGLTAEAVQLTELLVISDLEDPVYAADTMAIDVPRTFESKIETLQNYLARKEVHPEQFDAASDHEKIQLALNTGCNVILTQGVTYNVYAPVTITTNHQYLGGSGVINNQSIFGAVHITGGCVGATVELTFNSANDSSWAVKVANGHRVNIKRLHILNGLYGLYVEQANTVTIDWMWATLRANCVGIFWWGDATKRSDALIINQATIAVGAGGRGLDWNGNCHTLSVNYLGLVCGSSVNAANGKGVIIRNSTGGPAPAVAQFLNLEIDYAGGDAIEITAGSDFDLVGCYALGASSSGLKVAAAINDREVRITGGKFRGNGRYGIENEGGVILYSGNADLSSNTLGKVSGNVWTEVERLALDNNAYLTLSGGNPLWVFDANDYFAYDRTNNSLNLTLNGVMAFYVNGTGTFATTAALGTNNTQVATTAFVARMTTVGRARFHVEEYGAVADSPTTDNAAAIIAAEVAAAAVNGIVVFKPGIYYFKSQIGGARNKLCWLGDHTSLVYNGASTTIDLVLFGLDGTPYKEMLVRGISVRSLTNMTAGAAVRTPMVCRSLFDFDSIQGQDFYETNSNANYLYNGIYADQVDNVRFIARDAIAELNGFMIRGAISGPKADCWIDIRKIAYCTIGVLMGGAHGGLYLSSNTTLINNGQNLVANQSLQAETNRELIIDGAVFDVTTNAAGGNIVLDDPGALLVQINAAWICSGAGHALWVKQSAGKVLVNGGRFFNNAGDAVRNAVGAGCVLLVNGCQIHDNGGWGINPTVAGHNTGWGGSHIFSNTLGQVNTTNAPASRTLNGWADFVGATFTTSLTLPSNAWISNATRQLLYFDGTQNFYKAATHIWRNASDVFLGSIDTSGNLVIAGTGGFGAALTAPTATFATSVASPFHSVDANFYLSLSSSNPILNFDANDYLSFSRSGDTLGLVISSVTRLSVGTNGIRTHGGIDVASPALGGAVGWMRLSAGEAARTGYIGFYNAANTRYGYIGYAATGAATTLNLVAENGASWAFTGSVAFNGSTVTANAPIHTNTQTWNNAGVTFVGNTTNITDTNSGANSLVERWQVGNADKMVLTKGGYLGLGTSIPTHSLTIASGLNGLAIYNTADQTTNYERVVGSWSGNTFTFGPQWAGTGVSRNMVIGQGGGSGSLTLMGGFVALTLQNASPHLVFAYDASSANQTVFNVSAGASNGTLTTGSTIGILLNGTLNQGGTSAYVGLRIRPTLTALGSGANYLLEVGTAAANTLFTVNTAGAVTATGSLTVTSAAGTPQLVLEQTGGTSGSASMYFLGGTASGQSYLGFRNGFNIGTATAAGGTITSVFALTPAGNLTISGTLISPWLSIDPTFYLTKSGGNPLLAVDSNDYMAYDRTANEWRWYVGGGTVRFTIGAAGSLFEGTLAATGTISTPGAGSFGSLSVVGAFTSTGSTVDIKSTSDGNNGLMRFYNAANTNVGTIWPNGTSYFAVEAVGATVPLAFRTNVGEVMRITPAGLVGIGTTLPYSRLQTCAASGVDGMTLGSPTGVGLTVSNVNQAYGLNFGVHTNGNSWIQAGRVDGTATSYNLSLQAAGGFVGIGLTNPGAALHVTGTTSDQFRLGPVGVQYNIGRNIVTGTLDFYGTQSGFTGYKFGGVNGTWLTISSSGAAAFSGAITSGGINVALDTHKYHPFNTGQYFYDSYDQGRYFRLFTESAFADTIRFSAIANIEYHNGTAWTAWAGGTTTVQTLLDGREDTSVQIAHANRRFRFEATANTGWPLLALLVLQSEWGFVAYPAMTVTVEKFVSGAWTTKATATFTSANTANEWGMHVYTTTALHDGVTQYRFTIDITDWTDVGANTTVKLKRLMLLSNYVGSPLQPWTWDYAKKVTFGGAVATAGNGSFGSLTVNGVAASTSATANSVMLRDANGFTTASGYILQSSAPAFHHYETDAAASGKVWSQRVNAGTLTWALEDDSYATPTTFMTVVRSGLTVTSITLAATTLTLTGAVTGTSFTGIGTGLTALNGSNISSGTVADARLSANVLLKGAIPKDEWLVLGTTPRQLFFFDGTGNYYKGGFHQFRNGSDVTTFYVDGSGNCIATGYLQGTQFFLDANAYYSLSSGNPLLVYDANDYTGYNRTTNVLSTFIGGVEKLVLSATLLDLGVQIKQTPGTVAALGTATAGLRSFVSDATVGPVGNFGAIVSGGGSNVVPVWADGTNWRIG